MEAGILLLSHHDLIVTLEGDFGLVLVVRAGAVGLGGIMTTCVLDR